MKLDRCGWCLAVVVALTATGCGTRTSAKPICTPKKPAVSTTTLMAAELKETEDAPKVGKPQHTDASAFDEEAGKKDPPHRRDDRRPGGGFSGYK